MQGVRRGIFIDGSNLYSAAKHLGFDVDYRRLLDFFAGGSWLVRAYYYTAIAEDQEYSPVDRKSTRLNSSHSQQSRMPSSA